jgi:Txe/YoeB family toxin of Txe-Axe toxin-antitoxin module
MKAEPSHQKISSRTKRLINDLINAAQRDGWESDQGSEASARQAAINLAEAKDRLIRRLAKIELDAVKWREKKLLDILSGRLY